jgi:hypothetical protein
MVNEIRQSTNIPILRTPPKNFDQNLGVKATILGAIETKVLSRKFAAGSLKKTSFPPTKIHLDIIAKLLPGAIDKAAKEKLSSISSGGKLLSYQEDPKITSPEIEIDEEKTLFRYIAYYNYIPAHFLDFNFLFDDQIDSFLAEILVLLSYTISNEGEAFASVATDFIRLEESRLSSAPALGQVITVGVEINLKQDQPVAVPQPQIP